MTDVLATPTIAHLVICDQGCAILPLRMTDFPDALNDVMTDRDGVLISAPITRVLPESPQPDAIFCVIFHRERLSVLGAPRPADLYAYLRLSAPRSGSG